MAINFDSIIMDAYSTVHQFACLGVIRELLFKLEFRF